jgi:NAD(P)-dependent dehydrogenase (short-subunit alcohol dehydrogenase family)
MAYFTNTYHHKSYPAISPSSPLNSQSGKTVLITGSSSGIGFATAQAFIVAKAARVVILSRQESTLTPAVKKLEASKPTESSTQILGRVASINSAESLAKLWEGLKEDGVAVDILVLNAAKTGKSPILAMGSSHTWDYFETNVLSGLRMAEHFMKQGSSEGKVSTEVFNYNICKITF